MTPTFLYEYLFGWNEDAAGNGGAAVALGFGSMYNHGGGAGANVRYECCEAEGLIKYWTKRAVAADEELLIDYQQRYGPRYPLWFAEKAEGEKREEREAESSGEKPVRI